MVGLAMAMRLPPDYFFHQDPELFLTVLKLQGEANKMRTE